MAFTYMDGIMLTIHFQDSIITELMIDTIIPAYYHSRNETPNQAEKDIISP